MVCDNGVSGTGPTVTITPTAGQTIVCTVTNRQQLQPVNKTLTKVCTPQVDGVPFPGRQVRVGETRCPAR